MKREKCFHVGCDFCIYLAFCFLILPLKWVLAWLIASAVHECGHYFVVRFFKVHIYAFELGFRGAKLKTDAMPWYIEALSALAGPVSALSLLFFRDYIPCTAACAFVQSVFNLLPLFPLDGGRVIKCLYVGVLEPMRRLS